jgi:hypothetical protein
LHSIVGIPRFIVVFDQRWPIHENGHSGVFRLDQFDRPLVHSLVHLMHQPTGLLFKTTSSYRGFIVGFVACCSPVLFRACGKQEVDGETDLLQSTFGEQVFLWRLSAAYCFVSLLLFD